VRTLPAAIALATLTALGECGSPESNFKLIGTGSQR
jgi:hypothetical protein